jgi:hypothetical protein
MACEPFVNNERREKSVVEEGGKCVMANPWLVLSTNPWSLATTVPAFLFQNLWHEIRLN